MDESTRTALDAEAPVNPYSLLDALNAASARTGTLWLTFLAVMAYLLVTVAGVTHRDLLLDSGVALPILQARIDLGHFFLLAPALLALLHLGLVAQFVLLARKALEFNDALRLLESTDRRTHPLRLELDSFFFVQTLAGPERSRLVSGFLNAIGWITLVALPLLLLLYLQVAFLPVHDAAITSAQGVILVTDIVLLALVGVFLLRTETGWLGAVLRLGIHNPGSLVLGIAMLAGTAFVSLFLATIPGGPAREDRASAEAAAGPLFGLFPRNLDVADTDLTGWVNARVDGGMFVSSVHSINLRGRDLRFARLDRTNLGSADLSGANLDGASLAGAKLQGARLGCAGGAPPPPSDDRSKAAQCATARGADFSDARLANAKLAGADLRGAKFDAAVMEGADLSRSLVAGAAFDRASLERADLSEALSQQGTSFVLANLQGASLTGARLQAADFSGASLVGANLSLASLAAAALREADLEGADLQSAKLYGADLRGARLQGADLAGALVWRAQPPAGDAVALADLANIVMRPPGKDEADALTAVASAQKQPAGEQPTGVADLLKQPPGGDWGASADGQAWSALLRASEAAMAEGYRTRLTVLLARLACSARFADGAVATGLARRAAAQGFKGEPAPLYERLKAADCPASRSIAASRLLRDLAAAIEAKKAE
jgi:uncharacterized protein YjbI with pentapeptide repeats